MLISFRDIGDAKEILTFDSKDEYADFLVTIKAAIVDNAQKFERSNTLYNQCLDIVNSMENTKQTEKNGSVTCSLPIHLNAAMTMLLYETESDLIMYKEIADKLQQERDKEGYDYEG